MAGDRPRGRTSGGGAEAVGEAKLAAFIVALVVLVALVALRVMHASVLCSLAQIRVV